MEVTRRGFLAALVAAPVSAAVALRPEPSYGFLTDYNHFNYTTIIRTPFGWTNNEPTHLYFSRRSNPEEWEGRTNASGLRGRRARWAA